MLAPPAAPPEVDPDLLRELEQILADAWSAIQSELGTGGGAAIAATALPMFGELVLGLSVAAAAIGVASGNPQLAATAGPLGVLLAELVGPQPSIGRVLASKIIAAQSATATALQLVGTAVGSAIDAVFPSPAAVNVAQLAPLAHAAALIAVWQRAHHDLVHGNLVDAQGRVNAGVVAAAAASADAVTATVQAVDVIVTLYLPQAVAQLTATIQALKAAQQAANAEQVHALQRAITDYTQRIGDVVHWLTTEALPDIEQQLRVESTLRAKADGSLAVGLSVEAHERTSADASLLAQLAPLVAWFGGFGLHTTTKVKNNEEAIDQLARLDWSSLLAFASVPALVALISRLAPHVIGASAESLGGLEGAAVQALGAAL